MKAARICTGPFSGRRKHATGDKLNPTWMGESIGSWKGTHAGDRHHRIQWAHVARLRRASRERKTARDREFRRPDFNTLAYEATIEDPISYTKPWTTSFTIPFREGWTCWIRVLENNKDLLAHRPRPSLSRTSWLRAQRPNSTFRERRRCAIAGTDEDHAVDDHGSGAVDRSAFAFDAVDRFRNRAWC